MGKLRFHSTVRTGDNDLDYGIRDIEILQNGDDFAVFTSTGAYGGMAGYRSNANGQLSLVDTVDYRPVSGASLTVDMTLMQDGNSGHMIVGGHGAGRLTRYNVSIDGEITTERTMSGVSSSQGPQATSGTSGDMVFLANPWDDGLSAYDVQGLRLVRTDSVNDTKSTYGHGVRDIEVVSVGGRDYVITAAQGETTSKWEMGETGLTSYQVTSGGDLRTRDTMGAADGDGILVPTDMTVAEVGSTEYIVMASAFDKSGALSVVQVNADGSLKLVDHVGDTRDTRFGAAQAVETLQVDGRTYVVAGGGDDGVSLFVLAPGGRLIHIDSFADTNQSGLDGVTELGLAHDDDTLYVFTSSQSDRGVTQLSFDISNVGDTRQVSGSASGTEREDLLVGRNSNDTINGGGSDDILVDGGGNDRLTGGAGGDIFVFVDDDDHDRIMDFDVREDEIDLSGWAYFKNADELKMTYINGGVRITWHDEVLDVYSSRPGRIDLDDLRDAIRDGPTRNFDAPRLRETGTSRSEQIVGDWGDDILKGLGGNDTLRGNDGGDRLVGGDGNDLLDGGRAGDTLEGGNNNDTLVGRSGDDELKGGSGNDSLRGDSGDDTLTGGSGHDTILGGSGEDVAVIEVSQRDVISVTRINSTTIEIYTSKGRDTFYNVEEFRFTDATLSFDETVKLEDGLTLKGDKWSNRLTGGNGDDTITGEAGNDILVGGAGNDRLVGGYGDDQLFGGTGNDVLIGGRGNDRINGQDGNDRAVINAESNHIDVYVQTDGWIVVVSEEGIDRFRDVEVFQFNDRTLTEAQLLGPSPPVIRADQAISISWTGSKKNDVASGGEGNDTLKGMGGNDKLTGGAGDDLIIGGKGNDTLAGKTGDDVIKGEKGNDRIVGQAGDDTIDGGKGNDNLKGGGGKDKILGQAGNDFIKGGTKNDFVSGGTGADKITGNDGNDVMKGGAGRDNMKGGGGKDNIEGGKGADFLKGGKGADEFVFKEGDGNDLIVDFDKSEDTIILDSDLVGPHKSGAAVIKNYATVTKEGVVLDFGDGDVITLGNVSSLAGLADDITII